MIIIDEILAKLKVVLSSDFKDKRIFDKDLAEALDITQANFATMKNRGKIPYSNILNFCAKKKISINWLLYNQNPNSLIDSTDRYWIKYYPSINVSAGGGAYEDEDFYESLELPSYFLNILGGKDNLKNIDAINVTGDSMEPTLNSNNIIFIDKTKNDLSRDGIYAFTTLHGLFVKRVQKRVDGKLDIISDNKDYPIQVLDKQDLSILGKVISSFGKVY
ncbi:putative HTH-type transcriptional regulator [Aliarcobacter thereius]|uniref:Helix-turn-helix transcriptional regulator n=2 Tax=Aliarcobacter thereius TaxID=544718 RepID=A0A1C0B752_9BACT|nr:S24 family peptidase [Aliarcobacter thereius]OCL86935.1 putative HTH-type transcriptional regulator [Aliarcobacter thereius]OCL91116.1 putative HTH-type transcriptional regulator [Aliarcobacter thereius]OCL96031.1 putative HTH-type transcriptional regulator [Aliarcobacter thereius LMG 24486]OCL99362.1 putative HTH-type transcriptional regulator [Aliarcobacter thereius]QBF15997.1 peptidase, S24 family [Aliarcobacter thereius LMG 24486]